MDYLKLLEHSFKQIQDIQDDPELERLEYLAGYILEFTTYENVVSSLMAKKCLEVCKAISDRKTFEYIADEEGDLWYLIMVNMPFMVGKLSWGTSIRGAFWDNYGKNKFTLKTCGLFGDNEEQILEITFDETQWRDFIEAMIKFSVKE